MKLPKKLLSLFLVFSAISCGKGPDVEVCVLDSDGSVGRCFDRRTDVARDLSLVEMTGYVCFSPDDFETLLNAARRQ